MGLIGFYRRFIQDFGKIAEPLYKLLNKENVFFWSKECDSAVEQLKQALQKAPILSLWKLWIFFRILRIKNFLIKGTKHTDEFKNLTKNFIQRSLLNEILVFLHEHCNLLLWLRHLIGLENDSTGPGREKMLTSG